MPPTSLAGSQLSLQKFIATGFRCLENIEFTPDPALNLIAGPNASGKTSLLEAIFYLSRGRSFRASGNRELIKTGSGGFTLYGEASSEDEPHKLGVEVGTGERRIRVDGENGTGADLAQLMPVQAIDPEVHHLVQGGPEYRRRFLDWGVFHVKHNFLSEWRRYQKALKQRNAALRAGESSGTVHAWDAELAAAGEQVDILRSEFIDGYLSLLSSIVNEKLPFAVKCFYRRGWEEGVGLLDVLHQNSARDRQLGSTQAGPHRADLSLSVEDRRARYRVSRGQQKLLAATLVIAQTRYVAAQTGRELILLVDDPAAELDRENRRRLFDLLQHIPAQMFVTALEVEDLPWSDQGLMFHVEHGRLSSRL